MSRFEDYADLAAQCVANASRAADARYRSFLIDMATTWRQLARECVEAADGQGRLEELAVAISEVGSSAPHPGQQFHAPAGPAAWHFN